MVSYIEVLPKGSYLSEMGILNVQGVLASRDGHCLYLITVTDIYV